MPPTATAPTRLRPSDFTIPADVNLEALTHGDDDITKVIARFEARTPTDATALARLLELAKQARLNGTAGHQDAATLANQFPTVKVHWISGRLDDTTYSFLGIVDASASDEKRWIKAGRLHVEPFVHGHAASLDLMLANRSTKGVAVLIGSDDDAPGGHGDGAGSDEGGGSSTDGPADATAGDSSTAGEMNASTIPGLTLRKKSITPTGQAIGMFIKPNGYGDDTPTTPNMTMAGMVTRRRSI